MPATSVSMMSGYRMHTKEVFLLYILATLNVFRITQSTIHPKYFGLHFGKLDIFFGEGQKVFNLSFFVFFLNTNCPKAAQ